jgi:serine/threonine protein kinase
VFEIFEDDENYIIVSEMISGGNMLEMMQKKKKIDEKWAAKVIKQTLYALNYMHNQNIMHRDVKLENLLVLPQGSKSGEI